MRRELAQASPAATGPHPGRAATPTRGIARAAALALLGLAAACRRDAEQPLTQQQLFPDAGVAAPQVTDSARGSVAHTAQVAETEPNDLASQAQPLLANALVSATLQRPPGAPADAEAAEAKPAKKKPKAPKTPPLVDEDWYRLPALPPDQVMQLELRDAPACAELELRDDTGRTSLRKAKALKGVRAALPNISAAAGGSLVRVSCRGGEGGAYSLAVFTRAPAPGEELEPNDTARVDLLRLRPDAPAQGTLAPAQDVDVWALDLQQAQAGDAMVLSVTGIPDVDYELQIVDGASRAPLLTRRPGKGQAVMIPNLDPGRLGGAFLQLKALSGQSVDAAYALAVQSYLPPGCLRQADCRDRLPSEREPNDAIDGAQPLAVDAAAPNQFAGLIDTPGDVDWLAVQVAEDQVLAAQLDAPPAVSLKLQIGDGPKAVQWPATAGKPARVAGVAGSEGRVWIAVMADKDGGASRHEAYRLTLRLLPGTGWEREQGDERASPALWSAEGAMQACPAEPDLPGGGWQRRGLLWPAGDKDTFGLDLRGQTGPTGVELLCQGDGEPGLSCALTDLNDQILARVAAPLGAQPARLPLALAAEAFKVSVQAERARPSAQPYRVVVRRAAEAAGLPLTGSPTAAP